MRKIEDYAVFFIVGGLLVFSLSLSIINATVIPVAFGTLAMVTGLFLLAFAIIFYNRYTFLIILSLLIIASISLLFGWEKYFKDKEYIIEFILEFQKIIQFVRGYLPYTEELGLYVVLAIVGFLSLYMTLALYVTFQFGLTCALGFGLFGLNWIMNYERSDFAFLIFIFCFCVLLFKKLNARKSTGNLQALFIMPLCLAALYGAYRMPGFDTDWDTQQVIRFVRNPMDSTNDFLYFLFNPKYFSFRLTGYVDGKSRLGGSIGLSNEVVMEVIADKRTYLSGLVHNTYTGVEWINTIGEDFSANYNIDEASREAKETEYSLPIFSIGNNVYNDVPKERLTINPNMRRTATIFRPLKNYGVEHTSDLKVMTNTLGDVRFSDVLPVGGGYSFEYLDVDYENEIIKTLLRQSRRGLYKGVSQTLASYADYVYGNFVEIPEIVPQRVKDLALEITADYGNDYDRAQSIKDYLIEIPYTLTPGAVEDGFDFVDYFLFENRQGYCTYYASAMAILCRAIGLPTRYLEGYIMPAGQSRPRV
ncbi:MAG: transglutaminase domain-containing protein, partial [Clostridiales bacterium]|nr:transglutaminase domain-containing protein [Clostridiales bacterium]